MSNSNNNNVFDNIEKKSNVTKDQIFKIADSVKDANFKDDKTVRQLVRQVALMAGKTISKEKEDQIVKAVVQNNMPLDLASLAKMLTFKK